MLIAKSIQWPARPFQVSFPLAQTFSYATGERFLPSYYSLTT